MTERRVTKKSSSFWAGELQGGQYGGKVEDRDCRADTGRGEEGGTTQDGADPSRNSLKGVKPGS